MKYNTYVDFKKDVNDKDRKFKIGNHVRISKYKNIFPKGYTPNWSEDAFVIKKVKNTVPWTYVLSMISMVKKLLELQHQFRIEKVIKRKGDKLHINEKVMIIHLIVGLIKKI